MLISAYRNSHASKLDYKIYKKIIFGNWKRPTRSFLFWLFRFVIKDKLRFDLATCYLTFLETGEYPKIQRLRSVQPQYDVNIWEDICSLLTKINPELPRPVLIPNPAEEAHLSLERKGAFRPERSGFFSMVTTILAVEFLTDQKQTLDLTNWPYAVSIADLLDLKNQGDAGTTPSATVHPNQVLRSQRARHPDFEEYKHVRLGLMHQRATALISQSNLSLPDVSRHTAYFIRRGDKLKSESVSIPIEAYKRSIEKSLADGPVIVIGDDDIFNDELKKKIPSITRFMPFEPIAGSTLGEGGDRSLAILVNWLILCNAYKVVGDPNCNLVAMAMSYRRQRRSDDDELFPWSLHAVV